jgi:hypothetical protein
MGCEYMLEYQGLIEQLVSSYVVVVFSKEKNYIFLLI